MLCNVVLGVNSCLRVCEGKTLNYENERKQEEGIMKRDSLLLSMNTLVCNSFLQMNEHAKYVLDNKKLTDEQHVNDAVVDNEQCREQMMEKQKRIYGKTCEKRFRCKLSKKEGHYFDVEREFLVRLHPIIVEGNINNVKETDEELECMMRKLKWHEKRFGLCTNDGTNL